MFCLHIWDSNPLGHILNSIFVLIHKPTTYLFTFTQTNYFLIIYFPQVLHSPLLFAYILHSLPYRYYYTKCQVNWTFINNNNLTIRKNCLFKKGVLFFVFPRVSISCVYLLLRNTILFYHKNDKSAYLRECHIHCK